MVTKFYLTTVCLQMIDCVMQKSFKEKVVCWCEKLQSTCICSSTAYNTYHNIEVHVLYLSVSIV